MLLIPGVHDWFLQNGTPMYLKAALYGFLSSLSLPLGAVLGILLHPVDPAKTALIVAFGAGALIFAVSTELYAEALRQVEIDGSEMALKEITCSMTCAVIGAVAFTVLNQRMEEWQTGVPVESSITQPKPRSSEKSPLLQTINPNPGGVDQAVSFRVPESKLANEGSGAAMAMWLGVALDGIPESILLGFITNEKAMTVAFIVSIFLANFPEAFSSASMLKAKGMSNIKIIALWGSLCVITTVLSGLSSAALPTDMHNNHRSPSPYREFIIILGSCIEGLAGGAMLAMVCATMLPEAFHNGGRWSGLFAVLGFLMSCSVKVYFGRASAADTEAARAVATQETVAEVGEDVLDAPADVVKVVPEVVKSVAFLSLRAVGLK